MDNNPIDCRIRATLDAVLPTQTAESAMDAAFAAIGNRTNGRLAGSTAQAALACRRAKTSITPIPTWARVAAVACAVCLGIGGTAYAAEKLGLITLQQTDSYQTTMALNSAESPIGPVEDFRLEFAGLPENASISDRDDYFTNVRWNSAQTDATAESSTKGFSAFLYYLDSSDSLPIVFTTGNIPLALNGREGVIFEHANILRDTTDRDLYLLFPEEHRVLWLWSDTLSVEEMTALAESAQLVATGTTVEPGVEVGLPLWSDEIAISRRNAAGESEEPAEPLRLTASAGEMTALHALGDKVTLPDEIVQAEPGTAEAQLAATVTSVDVRDTLDGLDSALVPEEWKALCRADGTLDAATIRYASLGNGINSLDEIVSEEQVPVKLVEATVEYENCGSALLSDVLVYGSLVKADEENGTWTIYHRADGRENADLAFCAAHGVTDGEMWYLAVEGNHQGEKNHLTALNPGEKATVHFSWIVPEDELGKLLLDLSGNGSWYQFDETSLAVGYVDIRQS